jgi:putative secretion ATPase (PEP-CTERM system associated)
MYDQFYGFSEEPFRLSPDHGFAYEHRAYSKARAYMAYAFLRAEGFVMVTGRPGTGKTTLIGALVDQLAGENVTTANLVCTQLGADDLLKVVADEFGIDPAITRKGELLQALTRQFKAWQREGQRVLLIVDEAQDLSAPAMEELRLLTNIQVGGRPILQIFLLGQPELRELILSPQLEQVHQRIVAASHLRPLEAEETEAYIRHRLERVGWQGDPAISTAVYPLIYKFSEGVPRRINLICSRLFLHCAVEGRHRVEVSDVKEVIGELQEENLAAGSGFSARDFRAKDSFEPGPAASAVTSGGPSASSAVNGPVSPDDGDRQSDRSEPPASSSSPEARVVSSGSPTEGDSSDQGEFADDTEEQETVLRPVAATGGARVVSMPVRAAARASRPETAQAQPAAEQASPAAPTRPQPVASLHRPAEEQVPSKHRAPGSLEASRKDRTLLVAGLLVAFSIGLVAWAASGFSLGPLSR